MIGIRLQKIKPSYNKGQDTITFDWRGYWQVERDKILQQVGPHLGI